MTQILQGNMNRSKNADCLLPQLAIEKGAELLLLSEQYKNKESPLWYTDQLGTAAIWVPNGKIYIQKHGTGRGYVWVKSTDTTYFSC